MAILFPAYAPTSWELTLPGWPVITNSWRASEWPEILGSLPENARLTLRYENVTDAEALELLLLWRATAGGLIPLDPLPAQVAAGINDAALADRILDVAPMAWKVAAGPRQESVKAGRSTVDIELRTELALALNSTLPATSCPAWSPRAVIGCVGGADGVGPPPVKPLPPLVGAGGGGGGGGGGEPGEVGGLTCPLQTLDGSNTSIPTGSFFGTRSTTGVNEYAGMVYLWYYDSSGNPQYSENFVTNAALAGGLLGFRANYTNYVGGYGNGHTNVTIEAVTASGTVAVYTMNDAGSRQYQWAVNMRIRSLEPDAAAIPANTAPDATTPTVYENPDWSALPAPGGWPIEQTCKMSGSYSPTGTTTITWFDAWVSHSTPGIITLGSCAKIVVYPTAPFPHTTPQPPQSLVLTGGVGGFRFRYTAANVAGGFFFPTRCEGGPASARSAKLEYLRLSNNTWTSIFGPSGGAFTYADKGIYQFVGWFKVSTTEPDAVPLGTVPVITN